MYMLLFYTCTYVVVQFYSWFKIIIYFPLFQTYYHTLQCTIPKNKGK